MSRNRRCIISRCCYEFCFRAKASLPLSAHRIIREIIGSSVARAQRDDKIILSHDIWNGSHTHLMGVALDAQQAANFLAEVQKKITDSLKRLMGLSYLNIWEGRPTVARVWSLDAAMKRIAYFYSNPSQDDLEETIDKFPGYSSWNDFLRSRAKLDAKTEEKFSWIRLPSIPVLSSPCLTDKEDARLVRLVRLRNKERYKLTRHPNAWMRCFGVKTDQEVQEVNDSIIEQIRENELLEAQRRKADGKTVLGAARMRAQPLMKAHVPKEKDRKIYFIASDPETRIAAIAEFKEFCEECDECYQAWKRGDFSVEWPPGAFRPPLGPAYNVLPEPPD
jgi:hypothetical protein